MMTKTSDDDQEGGGWATDMVPDTITFLVEEANQCLRWADQATSEETRTFFQDMASKYCARAEGLIARSGQQQFEEAVKKLTAECFRAGAINRGRE